MDSKISELFRGWLSVFEEIVQRSPNEETAAAENSLREIEVCLAAIPADGMQDLVIKLGLHQFLGKHADTTSALSESAYMDLVRLAGRDPVAEIMARYQPG